MRSAQRELQRAGAWQEAARTMNMNKAPTASALLSLLTRRFLQVDRREEQANRSWTPTCLQRGSDNVAKQGVLASKLGQFVCHSTFLRTGPRALSRL